jgi:hypothetical protein
MPWTFIRIALDSCLMALTTCASVRTKPGVCPAARLHRENAYQVEEGCSYGFKGRLIWKKYVGPQDCQDEYNRWRAAHP